jgi:hypothetical protein
MVPLPAEWRFDRFETIRVDVDVDVDVRFF